MAKPDLAAAVAVAQRIANQLRAVLGAGVASVYRVEEESGTLAAVATAGDLEPRRGHVLLRESGIISLVLGDGRPLVMSNVLTDPRLTLSPDTYARIEGSTCRAVLAVPLVSGGMMLGAVAIGAAEGRAFTEVEITLVQALADQVAIAIENARLAEESDARQRRLTTMIEVARKLTSQLDPPSVLKTVAEAAVQVFAAEVGFRLIEGDELVLHGATPGARLLMVRERLKLGESISGRVASTGEPIVTLDAAADPRAIPEHRAAHRTLRTGALMCVPIRGGSRILGTLNIYRERGRRFDDDALTLAMSLAAQAGVALENARLYEEAGRRRREAETLARVGARLTEHLDLSAVAQQIMDDVHELLDTWTSSLRLLEPDGSLRAVAFGGTRSTPRTDHILPAGVGISALAVATERPTWSTNALRDPRLTLTEELRQELERSGESSFLAIPLRTKGQVIGVLNVGDVAGRVFSEAEVTLLQAFADHAVIALENARLFTEGEERRREAEVLADVARSITETLDLDTVLQRVTEAARDLVSADAARVGLRDPADEAIVFRYSVGARADYRGLRLQRGQGIAGVVLASGRPFRTSAYLADARIAKVRPEIVEAEGTVAELQVPITIEEQVEGVLTVIRRSARPFLDRDERVLQRLADHAAIAIRNGQLFAAERQARAGAEASERAWRQSEEQLRQSQKMEAVGQLAGGIAHDFNNLLTVIGARNEMVAYALPADDPQQRNVALIQQTADRAGALIRQLLAFSRKQRLEPVILDLNGVVGDMLKMLLSLIGDAIHLTFTPAAGLGRVRADRGQLEQVLLNLVVNARDAMPHGGQLTIETANADVDETSTAHHPRLSPGAYVMLRVRDTGSGMTPDIQARVFEPFFTTKEPGRGTGLGLSTVYGIIKQSDGEIFLDSAPGQGAAFQILLPRREDAAERDVAVVNGARGGTETILLVEDDADVRLLAEEILKSYGYTVLEARHPGEALLIGERHPGRIDLLLTDVIMPEMNGRELADRLRTFRSGLRVLFISGYADTTIVPEDGAGTGTMFLAKPFTPSLLSSRVRKVLDSSRQPRD